MFSIISELVYGIIYKNSKKEIRVMRHQEIHKFFDATLKRVLEGLKSYNNDAKHGYVTRSLSKEDVEIIIMVNVIPLDHVDDVPIVEPNQRDDVPFVPEPVLVDEDEDLEEEEIEEEEEPQEE
ncbi:hypothetical protein Tco_1304936 [Tanacetum coccineum]